MTTYYLPHKSSSNNVKVELDLTNYATKTDLKKITNVDVSSFASKTNLAALKTEVDKIDTDKLKTAPADLAKLTNAIENYVVKKTDYSTKITSIEAQIAGLTKNTVDNLADITKLKAIDTNSFVTRTKFSADTNALDDKVDVTNASLTSRLNDLKSQHIATEVTGIDNKTKKNASDILALENKLKQKEDTLNENERGLSFNRGYFFYTDRSYFVYDSKMGSFQFTGNKISTWKLTGIFNYSSDSNMNAAGDSGGNLPDIKNDGRIYVYLSGNHFQQNKVIIPNNDNVINIYCVYEIQPISSTRDTSFTIQNVLFGAMKITKNATDNSKNNYKGYGICFDERSQFGHTITEDGRAHTTNGRNVLIFEVDMSFSVHATNRANSIYVMGDGLTQGIHDTTLYVEKNYWRNFTDPGKKFIISLHYNGDESYFLLIVDKN